MNNYKIVLMEALTSKLYTAEQINRLHAAGYRVPLYTYKRWEEMGYTVKRGQHAAITCNLWKLREAKKTPDNVDPETLPEPEKTGFYMHKVHLFDFRQVEKTPAEKKTPEKKEKKTVTKRRTRGTHTGAKRGGRPVKYDPFDREKELRQAATYLIDYNWSLKKTAENMGISASTLHKWIYDDLETIDFDLFSDVTSRLKARKIC